MWLPWQTAFQVAVLLAVVLIALAVWRPPQHWLRVVRLTVGELVLMFTLYGIWQWVHERAVTKTAGAIDRASSLYDFEQAIHLPSELTVQHAFINHELGDAVPQRVLRRGPRAGPRHPPGVAVLATP